MIFIPTMNIGSLNFFIFTNDKEEAELEHLSNVAIDL